MDEEQRIAIVLNGGSWFVRRIAWVHRNDAKRETIYHCNEDLGGPFDTVDEAVATAKSTLLSNQDATNPDGACLEFTAMPARRRGLVPR